MITRGKNNAKILNKIVNISKKAPIKITKTMDQLKEEQKEEDKINRKKSKNSKKRKSIDNESGDNDNSNDKSNDPWERFKFDKNYLSKLNRTIKKVSKKPKLDSDSDNSVYANMLGWVPATKTKYYLMNDTCIDWLSLYYHKYGITDTESEISRNQKVTNKKEVVDCKHMEVLFEGGNVFEELIFKELGSLYKDEFVLVFDDSDIDIFRKTRDMDGHIRDKYNETVNHMKQGVPIIAQAVMINDANKTYGFADLLVRSDYLSTIFNHFIEDANVNTPAPKLFYKGKESYHYRVIDIKWTTMVLCVDGVTIRNSGFFPAYKGQLAVYTACLQQMQGYVPECAYVMAKAWKIGKTNIPRDKKHEYEGFSAFDRLGVINYAKKDKVFVASTKEAIKWIQQLYTEGHEWRYGEKYPSVVEMYPNMNKSITPAFSKVKQQLADRYGDATQVWYVGAENREIGQDNGIYDIRDPDCTISSLGITSKTRGPIIQKIIDINKYDSRDLISPKYIENNLEDWQTEHLQEYFVDFETINYNLFSKPKDMDIDNTYIDSDVTFMIGIGFKHDLRISTEQIVKNLGINTSISGFNIKYDHDSGWEFLCLYLTKFHVKNELELFRLFFQFVLIRGEILEKIYGIPLKDMYAKLFHWTSAELRFLRQATNRMLSGEYSKYMLDNNNMVTNNNKNEPKDLQNEITKLVRRITGYFVWVDACEIFQKEPIVVKGSYRFKLKHIGNAFKKHGFIKTKWEDGKMSDGFRAMLEAIKLYRKHGHTDDNVKLFLDIIEYNEVDCKVVKEIIEYLRANHIKPIDTISGSGSQKSNDGTTDGPCNINTKNKDSVWDDDKK